MGVTENSIVNWEAGQQPQARMYPAIIAFLGNKPWPAPEPALQHGPTTQQPWLPTAGTGNGDAAEPMMH